MKSNLSYNYIIHQIKRIDRSMIDMKETMNKIMSNVKANRKEYKEFRNE